MVAGLVDQQPAAVFLLAMPAAKIIGTVVAIEMLVEL
jgi:hypothetical protein